MTQNALRLKEKLGFKNTDDTVNKYFQLIDLIYYQRLPYRENVVEDTTIWNFTNIKIKLDNIETVHLALFLLTLAQDIDEQLGHGFND